MVPVGVAQANVEESVQGGATPTSNMIVRNAVAIAALAIRSFRGCAVNSKSQGDKNLNDSKNLVAHAWVVGTLIHFDPFGYARRTKLAVDEAEESAS